MLAALILMGAVGVSHGVHGVVDEGVVGPLGNLVAEGVDVLQRPVGRGSAIPPDEGTCRGCTHEAQANVCTTASPFTAGPLPPPLTPSGGFRDNLLRTHALKKLAEQQARRC